MNTFVYNSLVFYKLEVVNPPKTPYCLFSLRVWGIRHQHNQRHNDQFLPTLLRLQFLLIISGIPEVQTLLSLYIWLKFTNASTFFHCFNDFVHLLFLLLVINSFNLKNDRSCSIRTAGNHFIFLLHPALHNGTAL